MSNEFIHILCQWKFYKELSSSESMQRQIGHENNKNIVTDVSPHSTPRQSKNTQRSALGKTISLSRNLFAIFRPFSPLQVQSCCCHGAKNKVHMHTSPDNKDILVNIFHKNRETLWKQKPDGCGYSCSSRWSQVQNKMTPAVIYFQYSVDDKHETRSWICHANRNMIWHSSRGETDELRMSL